VSLDELATHGGIHAYRLRVSAADTAPAGGHHVYYAIYAFYMDQAVADQFPRSVTSG